MSDSDAPAQQDSYLLTNLYQDVYMIMASFLNGKELAHLSAVSNKTNKDHILEKIAKDGLKKYHPYLDDGLKKAHTMFAGASESDIYLYHLTTCIPTVQLIDARYVKGCPYRTSFQFPSHIHYYTEKVLSCGSIFLLVRSLQYLQQNYDIHFQTYLSDPRKMCEFASRLRRYGDRMFENTLPMPTKKLWNDYRDSFRATTKLYLFTHFQALVKHFIGDLYDLLIHAEMMDCVDNGMVDLVTGYRKIGAIIRPDCVNIDPDNGHTKEDTFCAIYNELRISYVKAVIWENVKNPQLVSFQATLTKDLLQRKLDAIIAAYSVGTIREWEKLQELQYITRNEHYTVKQMVDFGNALIELDGVKCYIKDDLAVWCSSNASN